MRFSGNNSSGGGGGQRYMKLMGSVLSLHGSERSLAVVRWDIGGIEVGMVGVRGFKVKVKGKVKGGKVGKVGKVGRRKWVFVVENGEVARRWVEGVVYAGKRSFWKWYELGAVVGVGSYARVHRCRCREGEGEWAVKIVRREGYPVTARGWIEREVSAVGSMWHENVVGVRDVFVGVDKVYIVMELMKGGTLDDYLRVWKKLPERYARVVARELLKGVEYCHRVNVVHRDIKPGNVFMSQTKFPTAVRLGDFGFCTFLDEKKIDASVLRTQIGTLGYVAREVTMREKYGPPADLWSVGCVVYEMLCGFKPFEGKTQRETFDNIRAARFYFDGPVWKGVSKEAKSLIRQLLQVDPNKRVSAFAALQHDWFTNYYRTERPMSAPVSNGLARRVSSKYRPGSPMFRHSSSEFGPGSLISASASSSNSLGSGSVEPGRRMLVATPSIKRIQSIGLQQATKENPAMMKRLLSSAAVQKQLSVALPYRRKLLIVARAFQAAARLRAMSRGRSLTKHVSHLSDDKSRNLWDVVRATFLFKAGEAKADKAALELDADRARDMDMAMESLPVKLKSRDRKGKKIGEDNNSKRVSSRRRRKEVESDSDGEEDRRSKRRSRKKGDGVVSRRRSRRVGFEDELDMKDRMKIADEVGLNDGIKVIQVSSDDEGDYSDRSIPKQLGGLKPSTSLGGQSNRNSSNASLGSVPSLPPTPQGSMLSMNNRASHALVPDEFIDTHVDDHAVENNERADTTERSSRRGTRDQDRTRGRNSRTESSRGESYQDVSRNSRSISVKSAPPPPPPPALPTMSAISLPQPDSPVDQVIRRAPPPSAPLPHVAPPTPPRIPLLQLPDPEEFAPPGNSEILATFEAGDTEPDSSLLTFSDLSAEPEHTEEYIGKRSESSLVQRMTSKFENFAVSTKYPEAPTLTFVKREKASAVSASVRKRRITKSRPRKRRAGVQV